MTAVSTLRLSFFCDKTIKWLFYFFLFRSYGLTFFENMWTARAYKRQRKDVVVACVVMVVT